MNRIKIVKFSEDNLFNIIQDGFESFNLNNKLKSCESVFIKPNLVTDVKEYIEFGANTDTRIIEAIIIHLSNFKNIKNIYLGEASSGTSVKGRNLNNALDYMGIFALKRKHNFEIVDLYEYPQRTVDLEFCKKAKKIKLNDLLFDVDLIINIPKIKTHKWAVMTSGLKNMFGIIPDPLRVKFHKDLTNVIANINYLFHKKTFVVVDGIRAMEGNGPMFGSPVDLNLIMFSDDILIADIAASRIMNFEPHSIPHLLRFAEITDRDISNISIEESGDFILNDFTHEFIPAKQNYFLKIEKFLMSYDFLIKIIFSDWFRKNITYKFRHILKRLRGGSTYWYVKNKKGE